MNRKPPGEVSFFRHSKAKYGPYKEHLEGPTPLLDLDFENQPETDLTEAGVELARQRMREYLDGFDPETDEFFIVSSPERRALDTATIFAEEARAGGFQLTEHSKTKSALAAEVGDGNIRVLKELAPDGGGVFVSSVFTPTSYLPEIHYDELPEELVQRWRQAKQLVDADDKGSWGANFHAHSAAVQEFLPEVQSSEDAFRVQFERLLRYVQFAFAKMNQAERTVQVVAFGHENYLIYAMERFFDVAEFGYCETLSLEPNDEGGITLSWNGQSADVKL